MSNNSMPSFGELIKALLAIAGVVVVAALGIGIVIKTAGESLVAFFDALGHFGYCHYGCFHYRGGFGDCGSRWWNRV